MFYIGPIEGAQVGRQMDGDSWVTSDVRCRAVHYGITTNISKRASCGPITACAFLYIRGKSLPSKQIH